MFAATFFLTACNSTRQGLFSTRSAHEKYADGITSAGLRNTQLGSLWFSSALKSIDQPSSITLPYKEAGYFPADKPGAAGYSFAAKKGEQVVVSLSLNPSVNLLVFGELWEQADPGGKPSLLAWIDTTTHKLNYEVEKDGRFIFRLQPELLKGVEYTLTISTTASLAFPVQQSANPRVTSFWGADRDGGSRSHEGVDIFAKFRTPVIAAADGRVTRVEENNLGGKVIFLRPRGKNYSLYYAHLDTQIARAGQEVRTGDILGLIGNTGNARTTAAHLHFGIYASGGAVDPFPFINDKRAEPRPVSAAVKHLATYMRSESAVTVYKEPSTKAPITFRKEATSVFYIAGATDNWYRVVSADNIEGFVTASALTTKPVRKQTIATDKKLQEAPYPGAPAKSIIPAGSSVELLGTHEQFNYVSYKEVTGWVSR